MKLLSLVFLKAGFCSVSRDQVLEVGEKINLPVLLLSDKSFATDFFSHDDKPIGRDLFKTLQGKQIMFNNPVRQFLKSNEAELYQAYQAMAAQKSFSSVYAPGIIVNDSLETMTRDQIQAISEYLTPVKRVLANYIDNVRSGTREP